MLSRMSRTTCRCVSTRSEIEPGNSRKYGVTPYATTGKHRNAERLGGFGGDALGKDAVDGEPEVAVLFGAAEREHGAVVVLQVLLDLHPVHVGDAHVASVSKRCRGELSTTAAGSATATFVRGEPTVCVTVAVPRRSLVQRAAT